MADDLSRYSGTNTREPFDPYRKQREALKKQAEREPSPFDTMLTARRASEWITHGRRTTVASQELFGDLWRVGEVAVLFGEKGSGKSVLAVQLADAIASGKRIKGKGERITTDGSSLYPSSLILYPLRPRRVLYLDFERTARQFAERYSAPSPIPGKLPVRCHFKFTRAEIEWDGALPVAFKKDVDGFMYHSIVTLIERHRAQVLIIDNLSYLGNGAATQTGCLRIIKNLKLLAAQHDISILVIAHSRPRKRSGTRQLPTAHCQPAVTLADLTSRHIGQHADSVFCIGHSTFAPEIRYVKHLASQRPITHDAANVLTYQLERTAAAATRAAPLLPEEGGPMAGVVGAASDEAHGLLLPADSQLPTANCFLGLTYIGPSTEEDHLRDYAFEARRVDRVRTVNGSDRVKRLNSNDSVVEMFLSREYWEYLER